MRGLRIDTRSIRAATTAALAALAGVAGCGDDEAALPTTSGDPGPIHVHGLGVDPADGALFIATHTGLFRTPRGGQEARRVGDRWQDTMGFTVTGPGRFLGSGHPDQRDDLPPFLGLVESRDAGRTWRAVSLQGKVDFHVLEASGRRIYGHGSDWETRKPVFLTSPDGGRSWRALRAPEPLIALAIDPGDPERVIASGERRIHMSSDAGRTWTELGAPTTGLLAWTPGGVYLAAQDGRVLRSTDAGRGSWQIVGRVQGQPTAFDPGIGEELLVALHDGTIHRSEDGARSWTIRSRP